ncbi:MAG TPA: hypothetical protein VN457_03845, partial [Chlamydiales bacterium]|nr:hypothetical protein [Chlamydiales bacterium]
NEPLFSYTGTIAFDLAAKKETEETSIKFSNLSEEELELWRLGRPSIDLRFELHPFSDLAKQLFLKQDKELLKITFHEKENSLPDALTITFSHLTIEVPLSPEELEAIIPTLPSLNQFLKNVSCNLPLFSETDSYIDTIHFDEKKGVFFVTHHEVGARALPKKTISLGPYRYAPHSGFYAPAEEKPTERYTTSQAVGDFLNRSLELIKSHLPQYSFYEMRHPLTYKLFLDDTKTLTIDTSLFEANDITFLFANWA